MAKCIICNKQYSSTQKSQILSKMHKENLCIISYPDTCLSCIKQEIQTEKFTYQSNLKSVSKDYSEAQRAYNNASKNLRITQNKHQFMKQRYEHLDKQAALLDFHIHKAERTLAPKREPKNRKPKSTSEVKRLLAQLSPEQRASLLKHIDNL